MIDRTATEAEADVLSGLTFHIRASLRSLESERTMPGSSADASDEKIKHLRDRVMTLRRLRVEFEDCMAQVADPGH